RTGDPDADRAGPGAAAAGPGCQRRRRALGAAMARAAVRRPRWTTRLRHRRARHRAVGPARAEPGRTTVPGDRRPGAGHSRLRQRCRSTQAPGCSATAGGRIPGAGLPGVKVKVGRADPREDEARVAAVRRLIGDDRDLMIDANMAWTADEALERGRRLEPFRPFWLEEPTIPEDVPGHARLARELAMPIAVGESLHSVYEFQRYVQERAAGVIQIDPVTNGGITASLRALRLADAAGLATSSHYTDELSAHLLCASRNPIYLEKHAFALDAYLEEPQQVQDGRVRPTEVPGNGLHFSRPRLAPFRG